MSGVLSTSFVRRIILSTLKNRIFFCLLLLANVSLNSFFGPGHRLEFFGEGGAFQIIYRGVIGCLES